MIVVLTTRGHGYTLRRIGTKLFGAPAPRLHMRSYESYFTRRIVPRATYIFADLERLAPWELRLASELYRRLRDAGLRCLNDPAKVKGRYALLRALHEAGINPFTAYRAEDAPRPARFPVFLRYEQDHGKPLSGLIETQGELEETLGSLPGRGIPLAGVIVVEYSSQEWIDGLYHKWGTYKVADRMSLDHVAVDDNWLVKYGVWAKLTPAVIEEEYAACLDNRFNDDLRPAFEIAGIEFGRADHSTVDGKTVVYEINTNPYMGRYVRDRIELREKKQILKRTRLGEMLREIDSPPGAPVRLQDGELTPRKFYWGFGFLPRKRP
ncbi:MAG: hypothetical protein AB7L41_04760 [Flavobacteriaceae bacterium]